MLILASPCGDEVFVSIKWEPPSVRKTPEILFWIYCVYLSSEYMYVCVCMLGSATDRSRALSMLGKCSITELHPYDF